MFPCPSRHARTPGSNPPWTWAESSEPVIVATISLVVALTPDRLIGCGIPLHSGQSFFFHFVFFCKSYIKAEVQERYTKGGHSVVLYLSKIFTAIYTCILTCIDALAANLKRSVHSEVQSQWMSGQVSVIVATIYLRAPLSCLKNFSFVSFLFSSFFFSFCIRYGSHCVVLHISKFPCISLLYYLNYVPCISLS